MTGATYAAYLLDSRRLTVLFLVLTAFWAVFLVVRATPRVILRLQHRLKPPKTTVELFGGNSLTLVIQTKGLPVKVRARATFAEFGDDMESHPAPSDLLLFTRTHGGRYELIELNESFDMAKSILGELRKLARDAAEFTVERPGLTPFSVVAQQSAVLAYLNITVTTISPARRQEIEKRYRLFVHHERIEITDDTEKPAA